MKGLRKRILAAVLAMAIAFTSTEMHIFAEERDTLEEETVVSAGDAVSSASEETGAEEEILSAGGTETSEPEEAGAEEEILSVGGTETSEPEETAGEGEPFLAGDTAVYEGEGFRVTFCLAGIWNGGYNANIRIENIGDSAIENWYLGFDWENVISDIWNAEVDSFENDQYMIKNVGWNRDIAAGESAEFGFSGQEDFLGFPEAYWLQGDTVRAKEGDYSVAYCVDSDWGSGFVGTITITNNTSETIEGWILEFDCDSEIVSLWGGSIASHEGHHYIIKNAGYNADIFPSEAVSFGFSGTYEDIHTAPSDFVLYNSEAFTEKDAEEDVLIVQNACMWLDIEFAFGDTQDSVTSDLILCDSLYGADVEWTSSNANLISDDGVVARPAGASEYVTLKAKVSSNDYSEEKEFPLYVIKNDYVNYNLDYIEDLDSLECLYLFNDGDPEDLKVYLNDEGYISFISGSFSDFVVESPEEAVLALYGVKSLMGAVSPKEELRWLSTTKDAYGTSFQFEQIYEQIPVYGRNIVVSVDSAGKTSSLHSSFIAELDLDTAPSVSEETARALLAEQGYSCSEGSELNIFLNDSEPELVWRVEAVKEGMLYTVLADAYNGAVVLETPCIHSELTAGNTSASGTSWLGSSETFSVQYVGTENSTEYLLCDSSRRITVGDASGYDSYLILPVSATPIQNEENEWTPGEVSAIANVAKAYDFYANNYGYKGMNGKGSPINVWIYYHESNSFQISNNLIFGTGGSYLYGGEAALDTVGHEYTHGVIDAVTRFGTCYEDAPGAIQEAYCDIFGYFIEGDDDPEWLHGEDNTRGQNASRSMSDPAQYGGASKIGDAYYYKYATVVSDDENDYGGIHQNCTIVSHACYLMWKNGITDKQRLSDLWYHSLLLGYDAASSFYTVRRNVLASAENMRMSADEIQIIKAAFDEVGIPGTTWKDIGGTNILTGKVVEADADLALGNNSAIPDAKIELTRLVMDGEDSDVSYGAAVTDADGVFSMTNIVPGNYRLTISKSDFYTETLYITLSETKLNNYCNTIELIPLSCTGAGAANGNIVDAVTGDGVEGLTLLVRKGINANSGAALCTLKSGVNGAYALGNLASGNYCVEVIDQRDTAEERYLTTYFNIKVLGGATIGGQNATVSTSLKEDQLRIVLDWGASPKDLDSHLLGPTSSGGEFHIYYSRQTYKENDTIIARLDRDDQDGYGPETTTIYDPIEGVYTFYVYNFGYAEGLTESGASVRVYTGYSNEPEYVFNIPMKASAQKYWTVFTYDSRTRKVTPVNIVSNDAPQ